MNKISKRINLFHRVHGSSGINNSTYLSYFNVGDISQLYCHERLFKILDRKTPFELKFHYVIHTDGSYPLEYRVARRFSTEDEVLKEIAEIKDKQYEIDNSNNPKS